MRLAFIDLEATSLDVPTLEIIEIGCCVYSTTHHTIETVFSTLVSGATENPAMHVNGIPPAALVSGRTLERAFASVGHIIADVDALAAHNGDGFERQVLERWACPWVTKPWLDTMYCEWPRPTSSRALIQVAHAHGVQIGSLHRAANDVLLMADLFARCAELGHDVDAMIRRAMRPRVRVVSLAPYEEKDVVKAAGFQWDGARKEWWRSMPREDVETLPFKTRIEVAA